MKFKVVLEELDKGFSKYLRAGMYIFLFALVMGLISIVLDIDIDLSPLVIDPEIRKLKFNSLVIFVALCLSCAFIIKIYKLLRKKWKKKNQS